jgi:hypothetical protein
VITVAVLQAIERLNPYSIRKPDSAPGRVIYVLAGAALFLVLAGFLFASTNPDGLQRLGERIGMAGKSLFRGPLADYSVGWLQFSWLSRAAAGLIGLALIYGACSLFGKLLGRRRSA